MLYAAAWFGAFVFGSDIDGRPIRGKGLLDHTQQYNMFIAILDCMPSRPIEMI